MAENRPKKKAVVSGSKVLKKPLGERFCETFFGGTVKDAKTFTVHEIIVPKIKDLIYDAFTGSLDRLLNGGGNTYRGYYGQRYSSNITMYTPGTGYSSIYNPTKASAQAKVNQVAVAGYSSSQRPDVILYQDTPDMRAKDKAALVLESMRAQIATAGFATVSDYKDFSDVSAAFTDEYYGWYDLSQARIKPERGGYIIVLPPTEQVR